MDDFDAWAQLRAQQHDVVTRAQLLAQGFTDGAIRAQIDADRWQRLREGEYALHSGPLGPAALRIAALLACRGVALLSHETAAELHGFLKPDPTRPIHTTVPYGTSAHRSDGLQVHRSRAFHHIGEDGADPPRVSRVHTVIDLAVAAPDAREAMQSAHRYALDAKVHPLALQRAVELRRPPRYRRALSDAIGLLRDGVLSVLEHRYLVDVEQAHGLPVGRRQAPVLVDGVGRFEDVLYDLPAGRAIVRLDGFGYHQDALTALVDRRRSVAAMVAGVPSVPYGWVEVTTRACRTARELEAVLRPLGWAEPFVRCGRCPRA